MVKSEPRFNLKYNLTYENEAINWIYNNKAYNLEVSGLAEVSTEDDGYICIDNYTSNDEDQLQLYTVNGELIFTYIVEQGMIAWKKVDKTIKIYVDEFVDAQIYENYNIVAVITGRKQKETKLSIYSMEGKLICEQDSLKNYNSSYLCFGVNNRPVIVCEGKYIFTWEFSINPVTGELKKISRKQHILEKSYNREFTKNVMKGIKKKE